MKQKQSIASLNKKMAKATSSGYGVAATRKLKEIGAANQSSSGTRSRQDEGGQTLLADKIFTRQMKQIMNHCASYKYNKYNTKPKHGLTGEKFNRINECCSINRLNSASRSILRPMSKNYLSSPQCQSANRMNLDDKFQGAGTQALSYSQLLMNRTHSSQEKLENMNFKKPGSERYQGIRISNLTQKQVYLHNDGERQQLLSQAINTESSQNLSKDGSNRRLIVIQPQNRYSNQNEKMWTQNYLLIQYVNNRVSKEIVDQKLNFSVNSIVSAQQPKSSEEFVQHDGFAQTSNVFPGDSSAYLDQLNYKSAEMKSNVYSTQQPPQQKKDDPAAADLSLSESSEYMMLPANNANSKINEYENRKINQKTRNTEFDQFQNRAMSIQPYSKQPLIITQKVEKVDPVKPYENQVFIRSSPDNQIRPQQSNILEQYKQQIQQSRSSMVNLPSTELIVSGQKSQQQVQKAEDVASDQSKLTRQVIKLPQNAENEGENRSNMGEKTKIEKRQELKNSLMQLSSEKEASTRRKQANTDNLKTPKSKHSKVLEDSRKSYTSNMKSKVMSSRCEKVIVKSENNSKGSSARDYEKKQERRSPDLHHIWRHNAAELNSDLPKEDGIDSIDQSKRSISEKQRSGVNQAKNKNRSQKRTLPQSQPKTPLSNPTVDHSEVVESIQQGINSLRRSVVHSNRLLLEQQPNLRASTSRVENNQLNRRDNQGQDQQNQDQGATYLDNIQEMEKKREALLLIFQEQQSLQRMRQRFRGSKLVADRSKEQAQTATTYRSMRQFTNPIFKSSSGLKTQQGQTSVYRLIQQSTMKDGITHVTNRVQRPQTGSNLRRINSKKYLKTKAYLQSKNLLKRSQCITQSKIHDIKKNLAEMAREMNANSTSPVNYKNRYDNNKAQIEQLLCQHVYSQNSNEFAALNAQNQQSTDTVMTQPNHHQQSGTRMTDTNMSYHPVMESKDMKSQLFIDDAERLRWNHANVQNQQSHAVVSDGDRMRETQHNQTRETQNPKVITLNKDKEAGEVAVGDQMLSIGSPQSSLQQILYSFGTLGQHGIVEYQENKLSGIVSSDGDERTQQEIARQSRLTGPRKGNHKNSKTRKSKHAKGSSPNDGWKFDQARPMNFPNSQNRLRPNRNIMSAKPQRNIGLISKTQIKIESPSIKGNQRKRMFATQNLNQSQNNISYYQMPVRQIEFSGKEDKVVFEEQQKSILNKLYTYQKNLKGSSGKHHISKGSSEHEDFDGLSRNPAECSFQKTEDGGYLSLQLIRPKKTDILGNYSIKRKSEKKPHQIIVEKCVYQGQKPRRNTKIIQTEERPQADMSERKVQESPYQKSSSPIKEMEQSQSQFSLEHQSKAADIQTLKIASQKQSIGQGESMTNMPTVPQGLVISKEKKMNGPAVSQSQIISQQMRKTPNQFRNKSKIKSFEQDLVVIQLTHKNVEDSSRNHDFVESAKIKSIDAEREDDEEEAQKKYVSSNRSAADGLKSDHQLSETSPAHMLENTLPQVLGSPNFNNFINFVNQEQTPAGELDDSPRMNQTKSRQSRRSILRKDMSQKSKEVSQKEWVTHTTTQAPSYPITPNLINLEVQDDKFGLKYEAEREDQMKKNQNMMKVYNQEKGGSQLNNLLMQTAYKNSQQTNKQKFSEMRVRRRHLSHDKLGALSLLRGSSRPQSKDMTSAGDEEEEKMVSATEKNREKSMQQLVLNNEYFRNPTSMQKSAKSKSRNSSKSRSLSKGSKDMNIGSKHSGGKSQQTVVYTDRSMSQINLLAMGGATLKESDAVADDETSQCKDNYEVILTRAKNFAEKQAAYEQARQNSLGTIKPIREHKTNKRQTQAGQQPAENPSAPEYQHNGKIQSCLFSGPPKRWVKVNKK